MHKNQETFSLRDFLYLSILRLAARRAHHPTRMELLKEVANGSRDLRGKPRRTTPSEPIRINAAAYLSMMTQNKVITQDRRNHALALTEDGAEMLRRYESKFQRLSPEMRHRAI